MSIESITTVDDYKLPGYENTTAELSTLLSGYPPPFIYIHDPNSIELTTKVLRSLLANLQASENADAKDVSYIQHAYVDAMSCLSQRSLYEALIHSLVDFTPTWEAGCANWGSQGDLRWNENMDSFLRGLRAAQAHLRANRGISSSSGLRFVLLIEGAERLKDTMPELLVPLTRLQELSQLDLCVIFASQVGWDAVKPPLAASPDPYFVDISPQSKETIAQILIYQFPALTESNPESSEYHPALQQLYSQFVTTLCDVCYVFTRDPQELQYIAAARWPGFVRPVLDDYLQKVEATADDEDTPEFESPSDGDRLRLLRLFGGSFTAALESLYPRLTNAKDWAKANEPEPNLLSKPRLEARVTSTIVESSLTNLLGNVPRGSKFILVASFLASTNPVKSDLRMFGRGLDEKKRRRRTTKGGMGRSKGGVAKIPQRLVGPSPFPLDRLIAILGALLEENDADSRLLAEEFSIPGEFTDMEITRRNVHSSILELVSNRLLHQTTKPDQIDGPPMFKCAISYDVALALAKELKVPLLDLLWEPAP